ncbi:hypothetical protein [Mycolicibacterium neoaurum]|uniref:hypothetical protein n=1 Tax=Mycolicibacterium neoaurum TaxID=1795 RepID=UPI001F3AC81C|nr:hypothetical protein [Mycolicibacterium neoaurum]
MLEAADWKDGIITILEPRSPYRPWRYAFGDARPSDWAVVVLGTDPTTVLTQLAYIDQKDDLGGAMLNLRRLSASLVDLTTLAMLLDLPDAFEDWRFTDEGAERMILALHETPVHGRRRYRWGHSAVAQARNLLAFSGKCDSCDDEIDLTGPDARDQIHVHTADPLPRPQPFSPIRTIDSPRERQPDRLSTRYDAPDWPAVLCRRCAGRMRSGSYTSFVKYQFAQHPMCPNCGGQSTQAIGYGMPSHPDDWGPWRYMGGCCPQHDRWHCGLCDHEWL